MVDLYGDEAREEVKGGSMLAEKTKTTGKMVDLCGDDAREEVKDGSVLVEKQKQLERW